jgi:hypothetical protein
MLERYRANNGAIGSVYSGLGLRAVIRQEDFLHCAIGTARICRREFEALTFEIESFGEPAIWQSLPRGVHCRLPFLARSGISTIADRGMPQSGGCGGL